MFNRKFKGIWFVRNIITNKLCSKCLTLIFHIPFSLIQIFQGNTNKDDVVKNKIGNPFQADTVRIVRTAFHGRIALRMEFYGCDVIQ